MRVLVCFYPRSNDVRCGRGCTSGWWICGCSTVWTSLWRKLGALKKIGEASGVCACPDTPPFLRFPALFPRVVEVGDWSCAAGSCCSGCSHVGSIFLQQFWFFRATVSLFSYRSIQLNRPETKICKYILNFKQSNKCGSLWRNLIETVWVVFISQLTN